MTMSGKRHNAVHCPTEMWRNAALQTEKVFQLNTVKSLLKLVAEMINEERKVKVINGTAKEIIKGKYVYD